jgi:hypothetical protein
MKLGTVASYPDRQVSSLGTSMLPLVGVLGPPVKDLGWLSLIVQGSKPHSPERPLQKRPSIGRSDRIFTEVPATPLERITLDPCLSQHYLMISDCSCHSKCGAILHDSCGALDHMTLFYEQLIFFVEDPTGLV